VKSCLQKQSKKHNHRSMSAVQTGELCMLHRQRESSAMRDLHNERLHKKVIMRHNCQIVSLSVDIKLGNRCIALYKANASKTVRPSDLRTATVACWGYCIPCTYLLCLLLAGLLLNPAGGLDTDLAPD
jgi:hypothetical protein